MGVDDMKISEIVKQTGLTSSMIRYYEKLGIIQNIYKDENDRRVFSNQDLAWIKFLAGFKNAKIPLKEMKKYAELFMIDFSGKDGLKPGSKNE